MNTCKTCKHWERHKKHYTRYKYRGTKSLKDKCYNEIRDDSWGNPSFWAIVEEKEDLGICELKTGKCNCNKFIYESINDYNFAPDDWPNDKIIADALYYCDGEEYSASFETGEDFGCIHHEQR